MLNQHRKSYIRSKIDSVMAPGGWRKLTPDRATRIVRTLLANKNLREVPADELFRDAEDSVHALARLAGHTQAASIEEWLPIKQSRDTDELADLFNAHGSDKANVHDYHEIYASILSDRRGQRQRILEIGLGTNNLAFQSNMGIGGRPGASLRAFRDLGTNFEVFGADIDKGVLFEESRIKTFFVDQTDPAALGALADQVGKDFDLIIDDGLHLPHANFNTIEALLPLLSKDGVMVIEDIDPIHLHYWEVAAKVLAHYDTNLFERRGGWLFAIRAK